MDFKEEAAIIYDANDCIVTLTINRPPLNILDISTMKKMIDELQHAAKDDCVGALILQAREKMFSAGAAVEDHTLDKVGEMIPLFDELCQLLADFPAPTIAAVQGHALGGGCELVLCCDLAIMAEEARIGQPEIQLAVFAPVAAMRLPALVGYRAAADIMFTGRQLKAQEALQIGLVNEILPSAQVKDRALEKAKEISAMSRAAQRINKRALRLGMDDWARNKTNIEALYLQELMKTKDALEGLQAFMEKRSPNWSHS